MTDTTTTIAEMLRDARPVVAIYMADNGGRMQAIRVGET
jgi:hypothetical protein